MPLASSACDVRAVVVAFVARMHTQDLSLNKLSENLLLDKGPAHAWPRVWRAWAIGKSEKGGQNYIVLRGEASNNMV